MRARSGATLGDANPTHGVLIKRYKLTAMSAITFDTLKVAERIEKAGATRELAAAIAQAQKDAFAEALDTALATRADVASLRADLRADIAQLRAESQAMELRLTVKLGAMVAIAVGAVAAMLRFGA